MNEYLMLLSSKKWSELNLAQKRRVKTLGWDLRHWDATVRSQIPSTALTRFDELDDVKKKAVLEFKFTPGEWDALIIEFKASGATAAG